MDWTYINTLLEVIHNASAAGPKYAKVASAADAELTAYMSQPAPEAEVDEEAA